jgi:Arc/MetJ family transcription regulator
MRTNIDIDDKLMKQAMKATGADTKKAAVEAAMRLAVQMHKQQKALKGLWGLGWEGDLDEMRQSRFPDWDRDGELGNSRKRKSAA